MAELTTYRLHTQVLLAEGHAAAHELREQLQRAGIDGWTERATVGYWNGQRVPEQVEFEVCTIENAVDRCASALVAAHTDQPAGVFQLVHIAPDGARTLVEARREGVAA